LPKSSKSDQRRPAIAIESHGLVTKEGYRSSQSEFRPHFRQPATDSTLSLPLAADARRLKKSSGRLSNVCHIKKYCGPRRLEPADDSNVHGRGKVVAPNRPFVQYQPHNINKFKATIDETFHLTAMFSLKSENENKV